MKKLNPLILYIEDNNDNRKLVKRILSVEGFEVHGVIDGLAGLDFVQHTTPDLILIDIQLPNVDGYTITEELCKMPHLANVPIVALTANVLQEDQEKSLAAGCVGFIHKPISVDELPQQVNAFLQMAY